VSPDVLHLFHSDYTESVQSNTQLNRFPEDLYVLVVEEKQLETTTLGQHLPPSLTGHAPVFLLPHRQLTVVLETIYAPEFALKFVASYEHKTYFNFGSL
jgi:hypothetical protein